MEAAPEILGNGEGTTIRQAIQQHFPPLLLLKAELWLSMLTPCGPVCSDFEVSIPFLMSDARL